MDKSFWKLRENWDLLYDHNFLLSTFPILFSEWFIIVRSVENQEMASGYAFYRSHPWFTIYQSQCSEASTRWYPSNLNMTCIKKLRSIDMVSIVDEIVIIILMGFDTMLLKCRSTFLAFPRWSITTVRNLIYIFFNQSQLTTFYRFFRVCSIDILLTFSHYEDVFFIASTLVDILEMGL